MVRTELWEGYLWKRVQERKVPSSDSSVEKVAAMADAWSK